MFVFVKWVGIPIRVFVVHQGADPNDPAYCPDTIGVDEIKFAWEEMGLMADADVQDITNWIYDEYHEKLREEAWEYHNET